MDRNQIIKPEWIYVTTQNRSNAVYFFFFDDSFVPSIVMLPDRCDSYQIFLFVLYFEMSKLFYTVLASCCISEASIPHSISIYGVAIHSYSVYSPNEIRVTATAQCHIEVLCFS